MRTRRCRFSCIILFFSPSKKAIVAFEKVSLFSPIYFQLWSYYSSKIPFCKSERGKKEASNSRESTNSLLPDKFPSLKRGSHQYQTRVMPIMIYKPTALGLMLSAILTHSCPCLSIIPRKHSWDIIYPSAVSLEAFLIKFSCILWSSQDPYDIPHSILSSFFLLGKAGPLTHHFKNGSPLKSEAKKEAVGASKTVLGSLFDPVAFGKESRILNLEHKDRWAAAKTKKREPSSWIFDEVTLSLFPGLVLKNWEIHFRVWFFLARFSYFFPCA